MPGRAPRTKCKVAQDCSLCPYRIKPGTWMGKIFETNEWVHYGCMRRSQQVAAKVEE